MKYFALALLPVLLVSNSCNRGKDTGKGFTGPSVTVIEGRIENGADQLVTLDRMGAIAFEPVDSVRCDENGLFRIEFTQETMEYYALKYTEQGYVTLATLPGEKVSFEGNDSATHPYMIEGSEASQLIWKLAEAHRETLNLLGEVSEASGRIPGTPEYVSRKKALNQKFDSITHAFNAYSRDFIRKHAGSPATLIALYNLYGPGLPVFDPSEDLDIYRFVDSTLYKIFPENEPVRSFHGQLQTTLGQMNQLREAPGLGTGSRAPDFVLGDPDGTPVALSDFRGHYVLLQFWASWSKPSVDELPFLENAFRRYYERGLRILMVSLDDREDEWMNAITDIRQAGIHVSDLMRWDSPVAGIYRLERIPANFLINPEGIIVEKDIFGSEIQKTLDNHL